MKTFILLGFRNIFRNKRRSILAGLVISLGLTCMIIADGFMAGMAENMYASVANGHISSGQVHNKDYELSFEVEKTIRDLDSVESVLKESANVRSYSRRVMTAAMVSSADNVSNIQLVGIDPKLETQVSNTYKYIKQGSFIASEDDVVLGKKLLDRLELELGDKVILTFSEAHSGELVQVLRRVTGVIDSGGSEMDLGLGFVHINSLQKLLKLQSQVHEVAIQFYKRPDKDSKQWPIWQQLSQSNNIAKSWREITADLVTMMEMTNISKAILTIIMLILVALSIVNTLFMAMYERLFEFGVMKALGTSTKSFLIMIISEAASLTFISVVAGVIITVLCALPFHYIGIDYSGMEFAGATIREPVRYMPTVFQFTVYPFITFVFSVLISLYPALHVVRMTASQAMRRSM